jgi:hypothetical protein
MLTGAIRLKYFAAVGESDCVSHQRHQRCSDLRSILFFRVCYCPGSDKNSLIHALKGTMHSLFCKWKMMVQAFHLRSETSQKRPRREFSHAFLIFHRDSS